MASSSSAVPAALPNSNTAEEKTKLLRVGWIGTGVMGAAMAARIRSAGYPLTIYARNPSKPLPSSLHGVLLAPSPAVLARSSDVLFTMLSHPSDVRSVVLPLLPSLPDSAVLVDSTSSSPSLAREIASLARSHNCSAVDAPVSGGDVGARDGTLAIFAGGEAAIVRRLAPLFDALGTVTYMGPAGSGQSAKIANQIAVSGSMLGLSEALVFAEKSRLDVRAFLDAIAGGAAGSSVMRIFGERIVEGDLGPGGIVEYIVKDLGMALDDGAVSLPGAALMQQLYLAMVANGDGKMGTHALITVIQRMNGIPTTPHQ